MTVDGERVARALEWADKVTAPGSGLSAVTVRATVVELAHLVRDLTSEPTQDDFVSGLARRAARSESVVTLTFDEVQSLRDRGFATDMVYGKPIVIGEPT